MSNSEKLREAYQTRFDEVLSVLAQRLREFVWDVSKEYPRIDRVSARAKDVERFLSKALIVEDGKSKYSEPLNQIQDQLAVRIVIFYTSDIDPINELINAYFASVEEKRIIPDAENEFGYEGLHHILFIPEDLFTPDIDRENCPEFFELQVKTLFQHAWAEANHDLAYKPSSDLDKIQKRKVAFTAAQAWGADLIFNELAQDLIKADAP